MVMLVAHTKTKMGNSCLHDNVELVVKFSGRLFTIAATSIENSEISGLYIKHFWWQISF
jgi:hypothetical protein